MYLVIVRRGLSFLQWARVKQCSFQRKTKVSFRQQELLLNCHAMIPSCLYLFVMSLGDWITQEMYFATFHFQSIVVYPYM